MMKWRDLKTEYKDFLHRLSSCKPNEILGVDQGATPKEIRTAYLLKVKTYHPDRLDPFMKNYSQEVMKLLNTAYETLVRDSENGN